MKVALQLTLEGHSDRVWNISWDPAEPILASSSSDKSVRFYSFFRTNTPEHEAEKTMKNIYEFQYRSSIPAAHNRTIRALSFSPTGATLATASFDATVGIWVQPTTGEQQEDAEWEPMDPLEGHESECKSVAWSFDGRLLASCSRDKTVWVWEAVGPAEFECMAVLMDHTQDVKALAWHPSSELLASASYDDTVRLFAPDPVDDDWFCLQTLESHTGTVWSISFSPCGNYLVSTGDDLVIKIWGRDSLSNKRHTDLQVAVREEGGRMGPWSSGGVRVGMKEKWVWTLKCEIQDAHERSIYSVDWGKGGVDSSKGGLGRIATCGGDGRLNVFQISQGAEQTEADREEDEETDTIRIPIPIPRYELISRIEDAHGVSDINHISWCKLSPKRAANRLRDLEGGESDPDIEKENDDTEDPKWDRCQDMFATAGDDGLVKVWMVSEQ